MSTNASGEGRVLSATYASSATERMSVAQLVELVEQVRAKNERLGVTGLLLYSGGTIVQTIEGDPEVVDDLLAVISADPRHTAVRVLDRSVVEDRAFSSWSMGFRVMTARELASEDFATFARQSVGHDLAPHVLAAFGLLESFRLHAV